MTDFRTNMVGMKMKRVVEGASITPKILCFFFFFFLGTGALAKTLRALGAPAEDLAIWKFSESTSGNNHV